MLSFFKVLQNLLNRFVLGFGHFQIGEYGEYDQQASINNERVVLNRLLKKLIKKGPYLRYFNQIFSYRSAYFDKRKRN